MPCMEFVAQVQNHMEILPFHVIPLHHSNNYNTTSLNLPQLFLFPGYTVCDTNIHHTPAYMCMYCTYSTPYNYIAWMGLMKKDKHYIHIHTPNIAASMYYWWSEHNYCNKPGRVTMVGKHNHSPQHSWNITIIVWMGAKQEKEKHRLTCVNATKIPTTTCGCNV